VHGRSLYPEIMTNIFFTIQSLTPSGGATMEDLKEAYREVEGSTPSRRTIYRILKRLQLLFDPLAYGETPEEGEKLEEDTFPEGEALVASTRGIKRMKKNNKTFYLFEGEFKAPPIDLNEALLTALSLYPHHRGLLKDAFKDIMDKLLRDVLMGLSSYVRMINDIDSYVYVAEPVPQDSQKQAEIINKAFKGIREKKRLWIKYLRTYDGALTERTLEPYGLLCRFNNWYLTGYCQEREERRLFLLAHIREIKVLEKSPFQMPPGYSIKNEYSQVWAVHTTGEKIVEEKVRLWVSKGVAERFRVLKFHPSQTVKELGRGEIEVSFHLKGADEMVPWLLSWGIGIKVLEPQWLRQAMVSSLKGILGFYQED